MSMNRVNDESPRENLEKIVMQEERTSKKALCNIVAERFLEYCLNP